MPEPHSEAARIFGERVRETRQSLALSQETVADLAEMHVTNFGKIERGVANPSLHTMVRIASVLSVDPAQLVQGIGREHLPKSAHTLTAAEFMAERKRRAESERPGS
jgi:transcriptional regulator with XRE-family HTH domain